MDIQEKKVFDAYFKEKYPELYKDVFDKDGDDRAIIGYSFALSAWQAAKAQAVPEGFVLVKIKDLRDVISNAGDAMMNEETSSVYDITGEPSTWFDHYTVAEKQVLKAIEAQESAND